jgi:hypothetical protein
MTDWRTGTAASLTLAVLLLCVVVFSSCGPQKGTTTDQPPKESGKAPAGTSSSPAGGVTDRVDGTLTVNGNQVSLKHVYAWTSKGAFDDAKTDVHILITDRPVPEEKLKSSMPVMAGDGPQGVELRIDEDKKVIEAEVYHSALKHGYFSGTGSHMFEPVSFERSPVEGKVHSDGAQETFGDKWEYSASFRANVRSNR